MRASNLAVSAALLLCGAGAAAAATIPVPAGSTKEAVRAAFEGAADGDTILFAGGGLYDLSDISTPPVTVARSVFIRSEGDAPAVLQGLFGSTAANNRALRFAGATIDVSGLSFEGFHYALFADGGGEIAQARVQHCAFQSCGVALSIMRTSDRVAGVEISHDEFRHCPGVPVTGGTVTTVDVRGRMLDEIRVSHNLFEDCWQAVNIQAAPLAGPSPIYGTNTEVSHNVLRAPVTEIEAPPTAVTPIAASIAIAVRNCTGPSICHNTIEDYSKRRNAPPQLVPGSAILVAWGLVGGTARGPEICHNAVRRCMVGIYPTCRSGATSPLAALADGIVEYNHFEDCAIGFAGVFMVNGITLRKNAYCRSRLCDILLLGAAVPSPWIDPLDPATDPAAVPAPPGFNGGCFDITVEEGAGTTVYTDPLAPSDNEVTFRGVQGGCED